METSRLPVGVRPGTSDGHGQEKTSPRRAAVEFRTHQSSVVGRSVVVVALLVRTHQLLSCSVGRSVTDRLRAMSLLGERLADKVSKFNSQINRHLESQQLNPFSGQFSRSPSPRPFAKDEYGKPVAGSLTEVRGHRAQSHICKEVLELCEIIQELGEYNKRQREKHRDPNDEDDEDDIPDDGTIIVTFGELFQVSSTIFATAFRQLGTTT
ncbi:uncharacterized protein LOC120350620 [Nilaparvata lugens]|uniref:uncharacterized protein LOC120350620 n=1 Tax=Nilaparvata lugens TaxID=108931 RepID=UPI00193E2F3A|nr:uncharacterized protein LOC120350620 [Nilaparvata lugens]